MKQNKTIIYSVFAGVTVVTFSSLIVYASLGNSSKEIPTLEAKVSLSSFTRIEYLLGESLDQSGIELLLPEGEVISGEELKYDYTFDSAGTKAVRVYYEDSSAIYESYFPVEVYAIRHIDVRNREIQVLQDGSLDLSHLVIWAELSAAPKTMNKPEEYPDIQDTVIILNPEQMSATAEEMYPGYYRADISIASFTTSIPFSTLSNPLVSSYERILSLKNASGGPETLTLFVQNSSNNFASPTGSGTIDVTGIYVYKNASGQEKNYSFKYSLRGWESVFQSSTFNEGLVDKQGYGDDSNAYQVEVDGKVFYATASEWHRPILNMD